LIEELICMVYYNIFQDFRWESYFVINSTNNSVLFQSKWTELWCV